MAQSKVAATGKMSPISFVRKAIVALRNDGYKGIHSVYSGFNSAWKAYYGSDPVEATRKLAEAGTIVLVPVKGGVMLYLPEDAPKDALKRGGDRGKDALKAMGLS